MFKKFILPLWEVAQVFVAVLISFFIIQHFVVQPFLVKGASMEPNFSDKDILLVDEISYRFRKPARGEVIVFRNPNKLSEFYIKRVIGLPGEHIKIKEGSIFLDNSPLEEQYLPLGLQTTGEYDFLLDGDEYFVLGDNRARSLDSRAWGSLNQENIIGTVRLRFWPAGSFELFSYHKDADQ